MAKLVVSFDEFAGITEYNGMQIDKAARCIINKAATKVNDNMPDFDNLVNYRLTSVDWVNRSVVFHINFLE